MNKKLGLVGCGYWGPNIVRNIQKTQNMCKLENTRG